uniref:NADH-ubiquinone oxidoreductase chain 3 n=1 Tax=Chrysomeloidea sp. 8 KM-2017 TaxID=2219302 RepID=A0A346RJ79_9CUCU|nr:NADH dehydrogenase subunit 3 [Chrysomeloidea sp. 8 KM-2017]
MYSIFLSTMMISTIMLILVMILNLVSKKTFMDQEKSSPFECGFDPKTYARTPFSIQFFLIAMIFLIFDVEIALLIPLIKTLHNSSMISFSMVSISFILILIIGLIHEWKQGALNWKK